MDETREILFQRQVQRARGEYVVNAGLSLDDVAQGKARAIRLFYMALLTEGFSEQEALQIIVSVPV